MSARFEMPDDHELVKCGDGKMREKRTSELMTWLMQGYIRTWFLRGTIKSGTHEEIAITIRHTLRNEAELGPEGTEEVRQGWLKVGQKTQPFPPWSPEVRSEYGF